MFEVASRVEHDLYHATYERLTQRVQHPNLAKKKSKMFLGQVRFP